MYRHFILLPTYFIALQTYLILKFVCALENTPKLTQDFPKTKEFNLFKAGGKLNSYLQMAYNYFMCIPSISVEGTSFFFRWMLL